MKKSILIMLALSGLVGGVGATTTTANAATWHKGVPKALRGIWKHHDSGVGTVALHNGKDSIKLVGFDGPDRFSNLHYTYLGHHQYKLIGHEVFYSPNRNTRTGSLHFKWYSKHHIKITGGGYNYYR